MNADGNETSGIILPEVAVPLGTYTGWNLRSPLVGAETMLSPLDGMFIPFAKTKSEREKTGDPRLSLEERYPTHAEYLSRLTEADTPPSAVITTTEVFGPKRSSFKRSVPRPSGRCTSRSARSNTMLPKAARAPATSPTPVTSAPALSR